MAEWKMSRHATVTVCIALALLTEPVLLFRVPTGPPDPETEPKEVVSKAIQALHEIFDFDDVPQKTVSHKKAPQFMVDLFNTVADSGGITRYPNILEGNIVRSFEDKVPSGRSLYYFNLSSVHQNEKLIKAELRIFRKKQSTMPGKSFVHHFGKIDIYELMESGIKPWRGNLISSRLLPLHTQGWEVFNVTLTVSKWLLDSNSNHGLLLVFTLPTGNFWEASVGRFTKQVRHPEEARGFLVLFSVDGRKGESTGNMPLPADKTSPSDGSSVMPFQSHNAVHSDVQGNKHRTARAAPGNPETPVTSCQRLPLYVDFEEIGWSGWIISPKGYNAYQCKGACPFPLGEGLRATNHATVLSIVNALKLTREVHTPCCVPEKLYSINLLYFDDEENVVLKQYDDMVAASCGCH
ncbi:bone morphogenetic protein 2-like [Erpetoichthys calabaricus]|uniref:bone morphogenetic protein 2-like n=1 Tax=Erpetoichthys calabaricus TaxID=27687 RepID=UPI002234A2C0|nr:bone morphogenetic protein 2-like [Erpetoichthys calabaricus]